MRFSAIWVPYDVIVLQLSILSPEYTNTISKINISVHRNVFALIVNVKDYGSEICLQDQSNADKGKRRGRKKKTV